MTPYFDDGTGIVIYHADCLELLPTLDPATVGAIVTDPPYGIGFVKGKSGKQGSYRGKVSAADSRGDVPVAGDNKPFNPAHLLRFPNVLLWGANHHAQALPRSGRWLAWNKLDDMEPFDSFSDVEFAWHSIGKASRIFNFKWKGGLACVKAGENNGRRDHPTQKPVGLMKWCLVQSGVKEGALVVDPYMGSGTTLRAAKDMNHRAIGIEIEERYCELAARRLEQGVFAFNDPSPTSPDTS